jgi:hypothetical protein
MSVLTFLVVLWTTPFLYLGWRLWVTWPSKAERERQREVSTLYDRHSEERRATAGSVDTMAIERYSAFTAPDSQRRHASDCRLFRSLGRPPQQRRF